MLGESSSLDVGEACLEAGDYDSAIHHLEAFCAVELDEATLARAQQALVVAYTKSDRLRQARDLCQGLIQEPMPPESRWAKLALADLEQRLQTETSGQPQTQRDRERSRLPVAAPSDEFRPAAFVPGREWRYAGRARQWQPLKAPSPGRFWAIQLASAALVGILLYASLRAVLRSVVVPFFLFNLGLPLPRVILYDRFPLSVAIVTGAIAVLFSTRILDWVLRRYYGLEALARADLARKAPEAATLLERQCKQRALPEPHLRTLPAAAPLVFAYGRGPKTARLVLSDGAFDLAEDELAALCAAQLFHIHSRDLAVASGLVALLQGPYLLYRTCAQLGDRLPPRLETPPSWLRSPWWRRYFWAEVPVVTQHFLAAIAASFYGIYWLWRLGGLWFVRRRGYYADRFACNLTGNPNGLARALLKSTAGIANQVETFQQTGWLLESFNLLLPVSPRHAAVLGSLPERVPFKRVLAWECTNPYRYWLKFTDTHALLGDRLYLLGRYASFWKLASELDLPVAPPPKRWGARLRKLRDSYRALPILQSAVLAAIVFGVAGRGVLYGLGALSYFGAVARDRPWWLLSVDWLLRDPNVFDACIWFAFSLSLIVWVNGYFPDVRISKADDDPRLADLLGDRDAVPAKPRTVRLHGRLLGRAGTANWLGQDLLLQTASGIVHLHWFSRLGPAGNLLPLAKHRPCDFIGRKVTVTGWLRRGGTTWIDVDRLTIQSRSLRSGYPVWITILAVLAALRGADAIVFWR